jgi:hypothetical protein
MNPNGEKCSLAQQIDNMGESYATAIVPNPNHNDAPYYTTSDRFNDIKDAFMDGAEWMAEEFAAKKMRMWQLRKLLNALDGHEISMSKFLEDINRHFLPNLSESHNGHINND